MDRICEPELMLDEAQTRAYAVADFEEPHSRFIELLRLRLPELPERGTALDLGCGPGDIARRFVRAFPGWNVDAVDGSPAMLVLGRELSAAAGLTSRIRFTEAVLPHGAPPASAYDLIFSNSLLHHLEHPEVMWASVRRWSHSATQIFVMDLLRPPDREQAAALVDRYSAGEPEVLRRDFYNSLLAAFRPAEVREQLAAAALSHLDVETVSDRHWIVCGRTVLTR